MIYFTSDLHFCHSNIIKMSKRPFADIDEMNSALIGNWNALVSPCDEVYILGDFLYKGTGQQANEILRKMRGKKYLVKGNHEKYLQASDFDATAYEWVKDYHELAYNDARFILFHYPILEWAHYNRKSVHLHGHIHSRKFVHPEPRAINVSVDCNDFYPVSISSIYERALADFDAGTVIRPSHRSGGEEE
jgi:calcineurin-like phosphoesterase family protein